MNIIALDIGNTNITIGFFKDNELIKNFRLATDIKKTKHEYALLLKSMLNDEQNINGGIISSVVPPLTNVLQFAVEIAFHITPMILSSGLKTGLDIKTDVPSQTGADRVADAVGATEQYGYPVITIDIGTAATFSVVNDKKQFLGGAIMPGPRLILESFKQSTARLTDTGVTSPKHIMGKNTQDAIASGVIHGTAATIDGMIARIEKELGQRVKVVATGGFSKIITAHCKKEIILDEDLLLKGLLSIYHKN